MLLGKDVRLFRPITDPLDQVPSLDKVKPESDSASPETSEQYHAEIWEDFIAEISELPDLSDRRDTPTFETKKMLQKTFVELLDVSDGQQEDVVITGYVAPIPREKTALENIIEWGINFRTVLLSESSEDIQRFWYAASELARNYFLGLSIKTADMNEETSISEEEWSENLRVALLSHSSGFAKKIYLCRFDLFHYFLGGDLDLKIEQHREDWCANFLSLLHSEEYVIVEYVLANYPTLVNYFLGNTISVGTEEAPETVSLSFVCWQDNFRSILASRHSRLIDYVLATQSTNLALFCGLIINIGSEEQPDFFAVYLPEEWCANFYFAMLSEHAGIITMMMKGNIVMLDYFCGKTVNLGDENFPDIQQINLEKWLKNLEWALATRCQEVVKKLYEAQPLFAQISYGSAVNIGSIAAPQIGHLTIEGWEKIFSYTLLNQDITLINTMLATHDTQICHHFFGDAYTDVHGVTNSITPDKWVQHFRAALRSGYSEFITRMWKHNLQLQRYFSGVPVKFTIDGREEIYHIDLAEWCVNFQFAVKTENFEIANIVWDSGKAMFFADLANYSPESRCVAIISFLLVENSGLTIEALLKPIRHIADLAILKENFSHIIATDNKFSQDIISVIDKKIAQHQQHEQAVKPSQLANGSFLAENRKRKQCESVEPMPAISQHRRLSGRK